MRFCPNCENLLLAKGGKLYCRTCDLYFNIPSDFQNDNVIVKNISHDEKEFDTIILKGRLETDHISYEDRKAYEDFFST